MMITAHGGAEKTRRNSYEYFSKMEEVKPDSIEVDIRKFNKELVLAHICPSLRKSKRIPLSYVFDYCKKNDCMVNCDVKAFGLVKDVVKLAKDNNAEKYIYFTGSVGVKDFPYLGGIPVYLNYSFFKEKFKLCAENIPLIKEYIESFGVEEIKGININYKLLNEEIISKSKAIGLDISTFTIKNEVVLASLIKYDFVNLTTNIIKKAIEVSKSV